MKTQKELFFGKALHSISSRIMAFMLTMVLVFSSVPPINVVAYEADNLYEQGSYESYEDYGKYDEYSNDEYDEYGTYYNDEYSSGEYDEYDTYYNDEYDEDCDEDAIFPLLFMPFGTQLATPVISLNPDGFTLNVTRIIGAEIFDFYANGVLIPNRRVQILNPTMNLRNHLVEHLPLGTHQIQLRRVTPTANPDPSIHSELSVAVTLVIAEEPLPSPVLTLDANGHTIRWNSVTHADGWRLYKDGVFTGRAFPSASRNADLRTTAGMVDGGTYQFTLVATSTHAARGNSLPSNAISFTFIQPQLNTPVISIDADGHTLRWPAVPSADHFRIYVDDVFRRSTTIANATNFNLRSLFPNITDGGTYDIRIRAMPSAIAGTVSNIHLASEFSNTVSFTFNRPHMPTPTITLDPDGTTIRWNWYNYISDFRVYVNGVYNRTIRANFTQVAQRRFDLGNLVGLSNGGTYQIQVRSMPVTGASIYWLPSLDLSNAVTFLSTSTVTPLQAPVLTLDADGHTIRWNEVPIAAGYRLYVNGVFNRTFTAATRSHDLVTTAGLVLGGNYQIQLRATTTSSGWSDSVLSNTIAYTHIQRQLQAPVLTLDTNGHTLRWGAVPNATGYRLYINGVFNRTFTATATNTDLRNIAEIFDGGTYQLQLRATSTANIWNDSPLSNTISFAIPQLQAPVITLSGHTLSWGAVPNATGFRLYVDGIFNRTFGSAVRNHDLRSLDGLISGGTYQIQLRATSTGANWVDSQLSNAVTFNFVAPRLQAPVITLSADGQTLMWGAVENAIGGFRLYVDGVFNRTFTSATRNHNLRSLAGLTPGGTYRIQLAAVPSANSVYVVSELSNEISFTLDIRQLQPPQLTMDSIRHILIWSGQGNDPRIGGHRLYVDGVYYRTFPANIRSFAMENIDGLSFRGSHRFQIRVVSANPLYTDSGFSNTITHTPTILPTPVLMLEQDGRNIRWSNVKSVRLTPGAYGAPGGTYELTVVAVYVNGVPSGVNLSAKPNVISGIWNPVLRPQPEDYISAAWDLLAGDRRERFNFSPGGTYTIQLRHLTMYHMGIGNTRGWGRSGLSNPITFQNKDVWQLQTPQIEIFRSDHTGNLHLSWRPPGIAPSIGLARIPSAEAFHLYVNGAFSRVLPVNIGSPGIADWGVCYGDMLQLRAVSNRDDWTNSELSNAVRVNYLINWCWGCCQTWDFGTGDSDNWDFSTGGGGIATPMLPIATVAQQQLPIAATQEQHLPAAMQVMIPQHSAGTNVSGLTTANTLIVNGESQEFPAVNIGGYNFLKLRDIAMLLNGTERSFAIGFDADTNTITITTGAAYTPVGGELAPLEGETQNAVASPQRLIIDGQPIEVAAFNIGGFNYFRLRDLAVLLDFGIYFDDATQEITLDLTASYGAQIKTDEPAIEPEDEYDVSDEEDDAE